MSAENILKRLKQREPSILGKENYTEYSILIPLLEKNQETHILFEVRSNKMRSQPGDVCFPGGRMEEEDVDHVHCAIRETSEELGIHPSSIQNITPLDYIVSDFGSIIYTFSGKITEENFIQLNRDEVEEVFTVPLNVLLQMKPQKYKVDFEPKPEKNFPYELIQGGKEYDWRPRRLDEYFYFYEERVIWGLTAKILTHFLNIIKQ